MREMTEDASAPIFNNDQENLVVLEDISLPTCLYGY